MSSYSRAYVLIPYEKTQRKIPLRALAFHQCGPGSIPGFDDICTLSSSVLYSAPRGFSPAGTPIFKSATTMTKKSVFVDLHISKVLALNAQPAKFFEVISRGRPVCHFLVRFRPMR